MNPLVTDRDWDERTSAAPPSFKQTDSVFESFFERSLDAVWLFDPEAGVFKDCNQAAIQLVGAESKQQLLQAKPADISPDLQPNGSSSDERTAQIIALVEKYKGHRFEWVVRHMAGHEIPLEVSCTPVLLDGRSIYVVISRDISERKKAEQESRELNQSLERRVTERTAALTTSEARFRAMVEHAPEAIVVYSADTGRFLFGNQHACDLYGVPMTKLAELTPLDVSPEFQPDGRSTADVAAEKVAEVLAGGMPVFEWTHRQPDGRLVPTEVRLLLLPADGQNLIRASIIDNTERKLAERTLRESEEKFRALFEGSSHGVVLHDEKELLEVNPAAVRLFGCDTAKELLGKHPGALAPHLQPNGMESTVLAEQYIKECMVTGGVRFEWLACAPNGNLIPMEVALTRIEWSGRQVIQAYITDITERTRARAALAESEARFSAAFQASPAFISILRASDDKYVLVNDAYVNWLGYSREEILGRTCIELGLWENIADRDEVLQTIHQSGWIRQREYRWRNRHGKLFTVLLSIESIRLNDTPHILSMAMDITERKRAEEELVRTLEREKELSQLKSNFVSMVSHEFRTPLGIIQSSAELLGDFHDKMPPIEREEQLKSITRNTRRMAGMMEDVLVLSRLDAGKLEFQPVVLDLNGFCRRVVDEVLSATNRRCVIELSLDSVLSEAKADEGLLSHIFTNLLSNAVKYSEPGRVVHFHVARAGRDAVCVVRDRGIGISEADQQEMFKAFHRGGNVGNRPGTGLGLLLVKRCADLHGGEVRVESKVDEGTTVTVRLPVFPKAT